MRALRVRVTQEEYDLCKGLCHYGEISHELRKAVKELIRRKQEELKGGSKGSRKRLDASR